MVQGKNTAEKKNFLFIGIPLVLVLLAFVVQENHPPVVKIISPRANGTYEENTLVRYQVEVSDKEDGESKFQEIPSNEVFLEVRYFADASKAATASSQTVKSDPPGLQTIKASNCLNCHAFNAKLIGPSFYDISKRYPYSRSNIDTLSKRILEGTTGVWGSIKMPTHPELTKAQTADIVSWILKNAADPTVNYYTGTEGSFRLKSPAASPGKGGAFVLIASYTDHGLKDKPKQNLKGQEAILIRCQ